MSALPGSFRKSLAEESEEDQRVSSPDFPICDCLRSCGGTSGERQSASVFRNINTTGSVRVIKKRTVFCLCKGFKQSTT